MKIKIVLIALLFCISCKKNDAANEDVSNADSLSVVKADVLSDKSVDFLDRKNIYNSDAKDSVSTMSINEDYATTISDPEKAALGYVATFIGNDCEWDGDYKDDRSNLKCKILSALNLGYQCSPQHLGFLRKMFKDDVKVQEELKSDNCPTVPFTATPQTTFDKINITVKNNDIIVFYEASSVNMRDGKNYSWTETDTFASDGKTIKLLSKDKSKPTLETF